MNLDPSSTDGARNRLLLKLLGGLVVTGVIVGLVAGVLGTTVLRSMGLKEQPVPDPTPQDKVTEVIDGGSDADESDSPSDAQDDETDKEASEKATDQRPKASLKASPNPASAGAEVTLSGSFRGLHGGVAQVQRREGGTWTDFPVDASLNSDGSFSTYIITSRTGTAPFRILHEDSGRTTPVVRVTIN